MRETVVWILFCVMLCLASFGWGYICRDREIDELRKEVYRLDQRVREINGKIIGIESVKARQK